MVKKQERIKDGQFLRAGLQISLNCQYSHVQKIKRFYKFVSRLYKKHQIAQKCKDLIYFSLDFIKKTKLSLLLCEKNVNI